ncbi:MAG: Bug family tripartite tricarboxylate transporter substrate binding protein [Burkholderiaceae bacterium]
MSALTFHRFRLLLSCCMAAALALTGAAAAAETYPARPIKLLVPFPAGGGSDILARILASGMSDHLGQPVVVDNRPGASTNIAAEIASKSKPDGYTLMLGNTNTFVVNSLLYKSLNYNAATDFTLVGMAGAFPMLLVVPPSSPAKTVSDFVKLAKSKTTELTYASPGIGSPHHLAMEMFKHRAGIDVVHASYRGVAPAIPDLMSGRVQVMFLDYAAGVSFIKTGKLRVLAVGSEQPTGFMPEVPTMAASGFTGFDITGWQGVAVPSGAPADVLQKLTGALRAAMADPGIQEKLRNAGIEPVYMAPPAFAKHIAEERIKLEALIRSNEIRIE